MKMFYIFKKGKQRELVQRAITKAGSERKLSKLAGMSKGSIYDLKIEERNLSEKWTRNLLDVLGINFKDIETNIIDVLSDNWGRKKGGINLVKKKKATGVFNETVERLKHASSKRMKAWHQYMKQNEPEKYHIWQYERFKKIGKGYPFNLENGIKVRNVLEKEVGDFLIECFRGVEYEPYLKIFGKVYFPDFVYKNAIIEVTEWKHPSREKMDYIKRKLNDYRKAGYKIYFFIPLKHRNFYKEIDGSIISNLSELKKILMPL